ncbi:MAG TPA: ABC transporter permease [Pirellulales bacterium]|nr:ABC transporter permease [Pirellulales bacterium]
MATELEYVLDPEPSGGRASQGAAGTVGDPPPGAAASAPASRGAPHLPRTFIRPVSGWRLVNARELWRYRELLYFLTWRDVKVRYKQTLLGAAWAVLQPAMMMIVFTIFFGRMANVQTDDLPYPLFAFCGLLPWTFFAAAIANAGNSVVGSERIITKIYFPRLAIPFASVGASLVDFGVAFSMLFLLMAWYRIAPTWNLLLVPPLVALFTLAALGIGTLLAALNVAYRDFRYVIPFLVQLWMFATPTVYMQPVEGIRHQEPRASSGGKATARASTRRPEDGEPETQGAARDYIQHLLHVNPLTGLVAAFRAAVVGNPIPWRMLGWSTVGTILSFLIGCLYFRRVEDSFADII